MDAWKTFTTSLSGAAASAAASAAPVGSRLSKQWGHLSQQARERLGAVDDVTELPAEYRALEARVDGLRTAHASVARIAKVYESEAYDCPVNLQESVSEASRTLATTVGTWAAQARGTPAAQQSAPPPHRTLAHTLSRAAASAAVDLEPKSGLEAEEPEATQSLAHALQSVSIATNSVGNARLEQDHEIVASFYTPWIAFGNQIGLATKARQAVGDARLDLDAAKQALKAVEASLAGTSGADPSRLEKAQTDMENAEDALVAATEDAIGLMKNVLENPEPVRMLGVLVQVYVLLATLPLCHHERLTAALVAKPSSTARPLKRSRQPSPRSRRSTESRHLPEAFSSTVTACPCVRSCQSDSIFSASRARPATPRGSRVYPVLV